jgi:DNA-binding protein HU-beta
MNKGELVTATAAKTGLTKKDTEATLNALLDAIGDALKAKKKVQLIGFGSFDVRHRNARTGHNPRTGEPIKIKASNSVHFSAGKNLNSKV